MLMHKLISITLLMLQLESGLTAKILGIIPTASYSHQIVFQSLWRDLSLRGHSVTVLTTNPIRDPKLTNLTEIDLSFAYEVKNKLNVSEAINDLHVVDMIPFLLNMFHVVIEAELQHPDVKSLINDETASFDVVLLELLHPAMAAFSHRFKCPFISVSSMDGQIVGHDFMGNPAHPVLYPDYFLPFTHDLNLVERIVSVLHASYFRYLAYYSILPRGDLLVREHFGSGYPPLEEIWKKVDMAFFNANPLFHNIRPTSPSVINIGGAMHIRESKPLPKDIKSYLDNSKNGVVYFNLGSNVKSKDIAKETLQNIVNAIGRLPYNVLWKYETDALPNQPKNVKIYKWVPQQDILRHPNIRAFITQGGLQSSEEGISARVPIVVMPFYADQFYNAQLIVRKGVGLSIRHKSLTEDGFYSTITEVISNPIYKRNMEKLSELTYDQPMTGLEKAVWWTEYVIRHKGAKNLRSPVRDLPLYQYYLLDIILFFASLILIIYYVLRKVANILLNVLQKLFRNKSKTL